MSDVKVDEVLEFLKERKTRNEIREKFDLSYTTSYNLLHWLKDAKFIEEVNISISGHQNRVSFFKKKD
jgi:Fe2+ or Zn2+ uptake regulation protein